MKSRNDLQNPGGLFAPTFPKNRSMTHAVSPRTERPSSPEKRNWYLGRDGRQQGPFAFADIVSFAGDETIDGNDLVWRPGLRHWVPAKTVSGLLSPPPLPDAADLRSSPDVPPPLPLDMGSAIDTTSLLPGVTAKNPGAQDRDDSEKSVQTFVETAEAASATQETTAARLPAEAAPLAILPDADAGSDTWPDHKTTEDHSDPLDHEREQLRDLVGEILQPPEPRASYVVRHWRGELSFTTSLFVNGILLTAAMGGLYAVIAIFAPDLMSRLAARLAAFGWEFPRLSAVLTDPPSWLRLAAIIAPWIAAGGAYVWSLIGIFRSAINRL